MKLTASVLAIVLLTPSAIQAQSKAPQPTAAKPGEDKIICRSEDTTGSRVKRQKRCLAASEWADLRLRDRLAIERVQSQRYSGNAQAPVSGAFGRFE